MIKTKITQTGLYRDGGTIHAVDETGKSYFVDGRIGSETKGRVFNEYPGEDGALLVEGYFILLKEIHIDQTKPL